MPSGVDREAHTPLRAAHRRDRAALDALARHGLLGMLLRGRAVGTEVTAPALLSLPDALSLVLLIGVGIFYARKVSQMSQALDRLTASTHSLAASVDAAVAALATRSDDSAQLNAIADQIDAARAKLDAAVTPAPAPESTPAA